MKGGVLWDSVEAKIQSHAYAIPRAVPHIV